MDSNLLTIKQVADKYGAHPLTVLEKIKQRCFTANKFGKRWLIDRASMEAYFKANSNKRETVSKIDENGSKRTE
jgi:excisionase family DNA binding protein